MSTHCADTVRYQTPISSPSRISHSAFNNLSIFPSSSFWMSHQFDITSACDMVTSY